MTDSEKIAYVQTVLGNDAEATNALVSIYLSDAEESIMRRLYRAYGEVPEAVSMPTMYERLQCRIAVRSFLRRGGEAELSHSENGVSRNYRTTDDDELLKEVIPYARFV